MTDWAQWVADHLRVMPEPASVPDDLADATPAQLGEARSRLLEVAKAAREVRIASWPSASVLMAPCATATAY